MKNTHKFVVLVFVSLLLYSLIGAVSAANTYNITDNSYNKYFNATGHINNTNVKSGDTLDLSGTIKNKDMYIDRSLNIASSTKTAQILNGTITILSSGSGTNVTNLKIKNSNQDGTGIFLYKTENNTIKGNQIHCNGPDGFGIALTDSNHNKILDNTVITTQYRISNDQNRTHSTVVLGGSNNNTIENNNVKSDGANCIYLSYYDSGKFKANGPSNNNRIINNTVVGVNNSYCYAIQIGNSAGSNNTVEKNKILSQTFPEKTSPYGIGAYRGISCQDEGGNTIKDNTISAVEYGIYATSNCIVSGNTVTNYGSEDTEISGIFIVKDNCIIINNVINMSSGYGIYVIGSNNTITGNKITNGAQESIRLYGQISGNNLSNNIISSKSTGIMLKKQSKDEYPTQNTINNNQITTSSTYAINTSEGTTTTITQNYLVSDNSNKVGNNAVNSGSGDTVKDNTPTPVTLSPSPGYYKNSVQVTLNMNGTGNIYYTINGSTPTNKSTLYTKAISITKTTTLKFITTDNEGKPSPVQTKTYTIDKVKPVITKIDPKNNAVKVSTSKTIKVTFNENIKEGNNWIELKNSNGKAIPFTTTINGKVLTIKPKSKLAESKYTLTIHSGAVTDVAGNPVALKSSKFSVGTSPKVTSTNPKNNAKNIARNKAIKVNFNENIKKGSDYWIELKASNGSKIAIKKSIKNKTLTITHTAKLKANTKYKLILHTGAVTDTAGNPVALKTISFTTGRT